MNKKKKHRRVYGVTEVETKYGYLCPCCWRSFISRNDMVGHHVVWRVEGGHGFKWNMLLICKDCHALVTMGREKAAFKVEHVCCAYMMWEYGLLFLLQKEYGQELVKDFLSNLPVNTFGQLLALCRVIDRLIRKLGQIEFIEARKLSEDELWESIDELLAWSARQKVSAQEHFLRMPEVERLFPQPM